jgi:hypothetical protein
MNEPDKSAQTDDTKPSLWTKPRLWITRRPRQISDAGASDRLQSLGDCVGERVDFAGTET